MKLDKARLGWTGLAVLVIFSILAWLFWDFVRDVIVIPIYYLVWLANLVLKSTPQGPLLILLVVTCFFIALNTLARARSRPVDRGSYRPGYKAGGRYLFWSHLLTRLRSNPFIRDNFAIDAVSLLQSILAYQEGVDIHEVEQLVAAKSIEMPASVEQLILFRRLTPLPKTNKSIPYKLLRFARRLVRPTPQDDQAIDEQAEEILSFIEYRLGIQHKEDRP